MGQLGLACSWIPRREIEPQLLIAPVYLVRFVLTAFTTDSPCLGEGGRVSLGRETRVSHLVSVWNLGGNVEVLVRAKYNPYTLQEPVTNFFLAYENVMGSENILLKETVFPHI